MRPTEFFEGWSERDRGLARAAMVHDTAMNSYGVPIEQATDEDTEGWWKVAVDTDYSAIEVSKALEKVDKDARHAARPRVWLDPDYKPRGRSAAPANDEPDDT